MMLHLHWQARGDVPVSSDEGHSEASNMEHTEGL